MASFHSLAVLLAIEYIEKEGHNDGFTFIITSHETIAPAIRRPMHRNIGLVIRLQNSQRNI